MKKHRVDETGEAVAGALLGGAAGVAVGGWIGLSIGAALGALFGWQSARGTNRKRERDGL